MAEFSHQYLIAVTVVNSQKDPDKVSCRELMDALERRVQDIYEHDGHEAFSHNDTEEI